jgi:hypothetical protein
MKNTICIICPLFGAFALLQMVGFAVADRRAHVAEICQRTTSSAAVFG